MNIEGAKCESCSLGIDCRRRDEFVPVLPETHSDDSIVLIGEAPGGHEVLEGRPFVGPSGRELQDALDSVGIPRSECQINNAICCRPPGNRLDSFMVQHGRRNKERKKKEQDLLLSPMEACRERLMTDLIGHDKIICLGAEAARALRGGHSSIMGLRGGCEVLEMPWGMVKVAYTLHPSFVLRSPKWRRTFHHDIARAKRFFDGELNWKDPTFLFPTTVDTVTEGFNALEKMGMPVAYDVETDAKNPLNAQLRCIGFANTSFSMVIPLLGIDGTTRFFSPADERSVKAKICQFLSASSTPLLGHNAGQYDKLVCEEQLGVSPNLSGDTLLLHLLADNEMPHNLGFVGSHYTDFTESWKSDHTAVTAKATKNCISIVPRIVR